MAQSPEHSQEYSLLSLNSPDDLIQLLQSGGGARFLIKSEATSACGTDCTCNDSMCGCRNQKTPVELEEASPAELEALKTKRINELQRQLAAIESLLTEVNVAPAVGAPPKKAP